MKALKDIDPIANRPVAGEPCLMARCVVCGCVVLVGDRWLALFFHCTPCGEGPF